jgi:hypothetical protein
MTLGRNQLGSYLLADRLQVGKEISRCFSRDDPQLGPDTGTAEVAWHDDQGGHFFPADPRQPGQWIPHEQLQPPIARHCGRTIELLSHTIEEALNGRAPNEVNCPCVGRRQPRDGAYDRRCAPRNGIGKTRGAIPGDRPVAHNDDSRRHRRRNLGNATRTNTLIAPVVRIAGGDRDRSRCHEFLSLHSQLHPPRYAISVDAT